MQIGVRLDPPVAADVKHRHPLASKDTPNQQMAVARLWILFAAKNRSLLLAHDLTQTCQASIEELCLCDAVVADVPVVVIEVGSSRSAAEFRSEQDIAEADLFKSAAKRVAVEMGHVA